MELMLDRILNDVRYKAEKIKCPDRLVNKALKQFDKCKGGDNA